MVEASLSKPSRTGLKGNVMLNSQLSKVYFLLPAFLLFTLAFGGIVVPRLNLILELICRKYYADRAAKDANFTYLPIAFGEENDQCRVPEVQSLATQFLLVGNLIAGLLSAVTSPKLGALSDRYGRTKVICATTLGMLAGEVITIIAATYPDDFPVYWLYLGFALDGLCGSFIAGMALAHSYAADCTPPAKRNVAFGYFHGCLFSGIALGPLLAAGIIKATGGIIIMFYLALGCHLIFIMCLLFVIPESVSKRRQLSARERYAREKKEMNTSETAWFTKLPLADLFTPLKILWPTGEGSSPALRRNLALLAAIDTIMFGVSMGSMTVVIYYSKFQFGWDTSQQSVFMSVVNLCRVTCLLLVMPMITRLVRGPASSHRAQKQSGCDKLDLGLIRTAVLFDTLGYLGYTLARTPVLFVLSGAITSIGAVGSPTLQSAMTKHVPHDRTGQLLGASGLLHALARVVAPTIFNGIYSVTVGGFSQTVFLCLTIAFGSAAILSFALRPGVYLDGKEARPSSDAQEDTEIAH